MCVCVCVCACECVCACVRTPRACARVHIPQQRLRRRQTGSAHAACLALPHELLALLANIALFALVVCAPGVTGPRLRGRRMQRAAAAAAQRPQPPPMASAWGRSWRPPAGIPLAA